MKTSRITLTAAHARRFLLAHQGLYPPRALRGSEGILALFGRLGCIQFDPISPAGNNPQLVLQARIQGYRPALLEELLYRKHILLEGMDKVWSIHHREDWRHFARRRQRITERYLGGDSAPEAHAWQILEAMRATGKDSTHLPKNGESVIWDWGKRVSLDRAALDLLNKAGLVTITAREGNRKTYDLVERVLPAEVLSEPDPHGDLSDYQRWHVLRRVGGLGLAQPGFGDRWLGILGMKTPELRATVAALVASGELLAVEIRELPGRPLLIRAADEETLERTARSSRAAPRMSFLPPLDNLLWDRKLIEALFGFDYLWEIYKKPAQRKYGAYTLPVLFGDRFVARCELRFDQKSRVLSMPSWWWEPGVEPTAGIASAAQDALQSFARYAGAERIETVIPGIKPSL